MCNTEQEGWSPGARISPNSYAPPQMLVEAQQNGSGLAPPQGCDAPSQRAFETQHTGSEADSACAMSLSTCPARPQEEIQKRTEAQKLQETTQAIGDTAAAKMRATATAEGTKGTKTQKLGQQQELNKEPQKQQDLKKRATEAAAATGGTAVLRTAACTLSSTDTYSTGGYRSTTCAAPGLPSTRRGYKRHRWATLRTRHHDVATSGTGAWVQAARAPAGYASDAVIRAWLQAAPARGCKRRRRATRQTWSSGQASRRRRSTHAPACLRTPSRTDRASQSRRPPARAERSHAQLIVTHQKDHDQLPVQNILTA